MKTFTVIRWFLISSVVAVLGLTTITLPAQMPVGELRVGVYDSRAIAVAYAGSSEFAATLKQAKADYQTAKQANDEKRMAEIRNRMKLQQRRMHEQGFSTGSVASIMDSIKDSLPAVAKSAGVDLIVSKWEVNYQSSPVKTVDVTDKLVALFHPNERSAKWAKEIQQKPPIPIEDITDDMN